VHGLRNGVRRLVATKKWTPRCEHLMGEITAFVGGVKERFDRVSPGLHLVIAQ